MPAVTAISALSVIPFGGMTYAQRVIGTVPIAYWIQGEAAGLTAVDEINSPIQDGTYTGVTLGEAGIGDGRTSPFYDGANDYTNIYTATFAGAFDGAEGSILVWGRVFNAGVWTDGVTRYLIDLYSDANNYIYFRKQVANNSVQAVYRSGGVTESVIYNVGSPIIFDSYGLTWSKTADEMRSFYNGAQIGATQNGLGVWAGALDATRTVVGAGVTTPASVWHGYLAHAAVWDRPLSAAEMLSLGVL